MKATISFITKCNYVTLYYINYYFILYVNIFEYYVLDIEPSAL